MNDAFTSSTDKSMKDRILTAASPLLDKGLRTSFGQKLLGKGVVGYFKGEQQSPLISYIMRNPQARNVILRSSADWLKNQDNRKQVVPHLGSWIKNKVTGFIQNKPAVEGQVAVSEMLPLLLSNKRTV
jgi:hypothetical protein